MLKVPSTRLTKILHLVSNMLQFRYIFILFFIKTRSTTLNRMAQDTAARASSDAFATHRTRRKLTRVRRTALFSPTSRFSALFFFFLIFTTIFLSLGEFKVFVVNARFNKDEDDAIRGKRSSFTLPLSVDVLLLGLDDAPGNDEYLRVDKSGLLLHLNDAFGSFSVFNLKDKIDTDDDDARKSKVNFNVRYAVKHGSVSLYENALSKFRRKYEDVVVSRSSDFTPRAPRFIVDAKELEPVVEKVIRENNDVDVDSDGKFTVVIAMPSATSIMNNPENASNVDTAESSYTYGYDLKSIHRYKELRGGKKRHGEYATSSAWVGRGNYAVVDLRAEGPSLKEAQKMRTWFFPTRNSIVEPFKEFFNTEKGISDSIRKSFDVHVCGELGKTIFDGVRSLHAPDIAFETTNYAKRVLVPIIALRDHAAFDPLDPELKFEHAGVKNKDVVDETADNASVDLEAVEREVRKFLLPRQELVLVSGTHELHLHHHIASAIARAKRHNVELNSDERFVKFSKRHVLEELRVSSDALGHGLSEHVETASSLLYSRYGPKAAEHAAHAVLLDMHLSEDVNVGHLHSKRGDVASTFLGSNRTNTVKLFGTRVVPVYILSLASYGKGVAMDDDDGLDVESDEDNEDEDDIRNDVASDENLVVVLQDASEISSQDAGMSDGMPSPSHKGRRKKANPNLTRDIIAGLAKTLGALPFEARKHKGRYFEPLPWAVGCHPFGGDLSNTGSVSDVIANAGRRNHIVSRLNSALHIVEAATEAYGAFANEYVNENDDYENHRDTLPHSLPQRISAEMRENLQDLDNAFTELAASLSSFEEDEDAVHFQSDYVLSKAMEFAERSRLTIENARIKLARCRLRRQKMIVSNSILILPVFLENVFSGEYFFFVLAVLAIGIFAISTGKRKYQQQNVDSTIRKAGPATNRARVTSF